MNSLPQRLLGIFFTDFLHGLFGDRATDLGGKDRPPEILVEVGVVKPGIACKIQKALYGLRTSGRPRGIRLSSL